MEVSEAIKKRRSVRSYKKNPIPEEDLNKVLEAARFAPSAHNAQDWKFVVIKDKKTIKEIAESAAGQSFIAEAPIVIAGVALNPGDIMSCGVPQYAVDLAIACDHITLQAIELGLGTCWIGAFSQQKVKDILGIPEECKVVALLPLGYPTGAPGEKSRKEIDEIVSYDKFS